MIKNDSARTAVVLDPHPIWLDAVEAILERIGVDVLGKTTSPEEALEFVADHRPSVLVTAIELGEEHETMDGIAFLQQARVQHPTINPIVLSAYHDSDHIQAALAAGAVAYVVKTAHPDDFAAAIRQSFGHSVFMAGAQVVRPPEPVATESEDRGLTRRELEILRLVAEGHSNAQLAKMLWVTEQTVKFHLSNIYRKLDVANRTEASRWAQIQGLLPSATTAVVA